MDYRKWILIFFITVVAGCGEPYPNPSGTVVEDHGQNIRQVANSVLPPKYTMGDFCNTRSKVVQNSHREGIHEHYISSYTRRKKTHVKALEIPVATLVLQSKRC